MASLSYSGKSVDHHSGIQWVGFRMMKFFDITSCHVIWTWFQTLHKQSCCMKIDTGCCPYASLMSILMPDASLHVLLVLAAVRIADMLAA